MVFIKVFLHIFVYVVIICPINDILCQDVKAAPAHAVPGARKPCGLCPGAGTCVPRVRCPAHLRSKHQVCHVGTLVGVCCVTGSHHAAVSDTKFRASSPISIDDVLQSHHSSRQRLASWMDLVQRVMQSPHVLVNISSPSYGHFLSTRHSDPRAEVWGRGALLNLFAAEHLKTRQAISDTQLALGLTEHTDAPFCLPPAACPSPPGRYRLLNGSCNNAVAGNWGSSNTGFERLLPPDYSDGIWSIRSSSKGQALPSAREVSARLLLQGSHPSDTHNLLFMQFGQFIAHDTSATVAFTAGSPVTSPKKCCFTNKFSRRVPDLYVDNATGISCCDAAGHPLPPPLLHPACLAVQAANDDPFYKNFNVTCLNFVRAQLAPSSDCTVGYAKQMNGATHFLDLSHLYGSTEEKSRSLRAPGGLLRTFSDYGRELPPLTEREECLSMKENGACFDSGDNHGNQVITLTVLHTLWTREHNRVARELARLRPRWDDDAVFLQARRLLQAEFQHIVYNEWLPLLLGTEIPAAFELAPSPGYSSSYDANLNPSLTAEFAAAAMRFGHSVVDGRIVIPEPRTNDVHEVISLSEVMFSPHRLRLRPFLDRALLGLARPMQAADPFLTESLTRYMFHGTQPYGLDLASINVQRGRDFGVRPYNDYRRLIGIPPIVDFAQYLPNAARRLSSVYESPEDIDLWIGGLLEESVPDGVVGDTFAHILADQFARLKKGDRYFYEYGKDVNPGAFSPSQLSEIKKASMARIICDNSDGIELFSQSPNAFLRADLPGNEPVTCETSVIPVIDLSKFN